MRHQSCSFVGILRVDTEGSTGTVFFSQLSTSIGLRHIHFLTLLVAGFDGLRMDTGSQALIVDSRPTPGALLFDSSFASSVIGVSVHDTALILNKAPTNLQTKLPMSLQRVWEEYGKFRGSLGLQDTRGSGGVELLLFMRSCYVWIDRFDTPAAVGLTLIGASPAKHRRSTVNPVCEFLLV